MLSQVEVTNEQIQGLHDGYRLYGNNSAIDFLGMWLLSASEDVDDIMTGLTGVRRTARLNADKCSASVRFDRANNELYTGHTTWCVAFVRRPSFVRLFRRVLGRSIHKCFDN